MRGVLFTFDALLAIFIVAAVVPMILAFSTTTENKNEIVFSEADSAIDSLSQLTVRNVIQEPVMRNLYSEGKLTNSDLDKTVMDLIVGLWASNSTENLTMAQNITTQLIGKIVPSNFASSVSIENETLFNENGTMKKIYASSRRIASGYMKGEKSAGYLTSIFLTSIGGKRAQSYYFFGGFVGQGNISFNVTDLANDANVSFIYMEMFVGSNFSLYINNNYCGIFNRSSTGISSDNWTINNPVCLNMIMPGTSNRFGIVFSGDISQSYIGGGFLKIVYKTDQLSPGYNFTKYYLPSIEGAINYFDAFYIPGVLNNMNIHLEFYSKHKLSMVVGNTSVFNFTGSSANQSIDINDSVLRNLLNYSKLSGQNIPIRLGATKETEGNVSMGIADTVLLTSTSGEMGNCDIINGSSMACGASGNVTRIAAAKESDIQFAKTILGMQGNRVANLGYHNNAPDSESLVELDTRLSYVRANGINKLGLHGASQRCYACAIDEARRRLIPSDAHVPAGALAPTGPGSNYNKSRIIILMSDGNANFCDNADDAVGHYNQNCNATNAKQQAVDQACFMPTHEPYSVNESNITIYTIAFGSNIDNSTLISIADCTGGKFYQSSNYSELLNIYKQIGESIAAIFFSQQTVNISGVGESSLYQNSYISYDYTGNESQPDYQEIQIDLETEKFNSCRGSFFVPYPMRIVDSKITSYSSNFWTSLVQINNSEEKTIFNLSSFGDDFLPLGDPFRIEINPDSIMINKTNNITVNLAADAFEISPNCSDSNRVIYSSRIKASVPYGSVFSSSSGGIVRIYYDIDHDGISDGFTDVSYGTNLPGFNATVKTVDQLNTTSNALEDALLRLLNELNYVIISSNSGTAGSQTNPIDIKLADVNIDTTTVGGIPYAWGPLGIRLDVTV